MLSKNKIKYINSLSMKKNRKDERVFVAEGNKLVTDLISSLSCKTLIATSEWLECNKGLIAEETVCATHEEIKKISQQKTPQDVIAIFYQPQHEKPKNIGQDNICLVLDDIQDPGNLGTIVRIADWFGIEDIVCSPNSADIYNSKVVQATMGAIARVRVHYTDIEAFLSDKKENIYGTLLDGDNIYEKELSRNGFIVMGNEGNGISKEVRKLINSKLYIPNYPQGRETSESLNVAIATAIVCAEFRRRESL